MGIFWKNMKELVSQYDGRLFSRIFEHEIQNQGNYVLGIFEILYGLQRISSCEVLSL